MQSIKKMLLWISVILFAILIHLYFNDGYLTDFIGIIGFVLVIVAYHSKD